MINIKNISNLLSNIIGNDKLNIDIENETKNFSIKDFYLNSGDASGAVIIITPNQVIKTPLVYGYSHGATVDNIYQKIIPNYKDFSNEIESIEISDDTVQIATWEKIAMNFNHIILKLVKLEDKNKAYGLNEGFVPDNINEFQYEQLIKLNNEMTDSEIDINFYYPYNDFNEDLYKKLDFLVATMYDYIDNNITSDEIIINSESNHKIK